MQGFEPADETERSLADALRELQPAPMDVPPERIWYRAGVAAGRRQVNAWRAIAAGAVILAGASLRFPISAPPAIEPFRQIAREPKTPVVVAAEAGPDDTTESTSYLVLRNDLVEKGLDALPADLPRQRPAVWENLNRWDVEGFLPRRHGEHLGERG
jgi:hypothetical protein